MGHDASLCIRIYNSTDKEINFIVKPLSNKIIPTKTITDFNLHPHEYFLISEHFIDYDQMELGRQGNMILREIEIKCNDQLINTMELVCSKFCPDPFYRISTMDSNPYGYVVRNKRIRGYSGPTTIEIALNKEKK